MLHTGSSPFAITSGVGNHVLILFLIGIMGVVLVKIKCGAFFKWENFRSLRYGIVYAGLFLLFAIGVHELEWYFTYLLAHYPHPVIILSSTMFGIGIAGILLNFFARPFTLPDLKLVLLMGVYYAVWFSLGFHITNSFAGLTPYLNDLGTNLTEDGSWVYLLTGVVLFYRKE